MSWFRRRLMMLQEEEPPVTPYDAKIEYISTDGNQWLKLPVYASEATDAVELDFERTKNTNQQRYCCAESGASAFQVYVNSSGKLAYRNNNGWRGTSSASIGLTRHTILVDWLNHIVKLDSTTLSWAGGSSTYVQNNYLTVLKPWGSNASIQGKLYSFKFWRNGILTYNLIPVRKNGVGYMYDEVTNTLFDNKGTGSFGLGADI